MSKLLDGKVIVVTGGAGLLGQAFCTTIAAHGGVAVVADRDLDAATRVADAVATSHPSGSWAIGLDITDKASIVAAIEAVRARHPKIDAMVNGAYPRNAAYGRAMEDVTYADFCDNVGMHLGGYFLVAQQFAAAFRAQGHGHIVSIASVYGVIAPRFEIYEGTTMIMPVEYAAIKSGVLHLTRYFAKYLKGTNVRVNAISPGGIEDGQPEAFLRKYREHCSSRGMLERTDVTGALVFLLSDLSLFVNGQNLIVDDGFSL